MNLLVSFPRMRIIPNKSDSSCENIKHNTFYWAQLYIELLITTVQLVLDFVTSFLFSSFIKRNILFKFPRQF